MKLIKLGSNYGGWIIPDIFSSKSICYFAGVGEDITFDVDFVNRYDCEVNLIDPTPRAIAHFNEVKNYSKVKNIYPKPSDFFYGHYKISTSQLDKIKYHSIGLDIDNDKVIFYPPLDNSHVSHSALNLQNTNKKNSFMAKCKSLSSFMKMLGHDHIDCLKLDIEGSELNIVNEIISKKINVKVLCVEFDYIKKIKKPTLDTMIKNLESANYILVSNEFNHTFVLKSV